jgi:hypothetical protein
MHNYFCANVGKQKQAGRYLGNIGKNCFKGSLFQAFDVGDVHFFSAEKRYQPFRFEICK